MVVGDPTKADASFLVDPPYLISSTNMAESPIRIGVLSSCPMDLCSNHVRYNVPIERDASRSRVSSISG